MDWMEFILNNDAAIGTIIGLGVLAGIAVFMVGYATMHIMNDKGQD